MKESTHVEKVVMFKDDGQFYSFRKKLEEDLKSRGINISNGFEYDPSHYPVLVVFDWEKEGDMVIIECNDITIIDVDIIDEDIENK